MTLHADPGREIFPPETLDALFDAVENDDVVDPEVCLPDPIVMDCTERDMRRCFALCLQFWEDGVVREDLLRLVRVLLRQRDLDPVQRAAFKHIRAKYKHLRFALTLYSARHKAPLPFRATVVTMGHLQDAFRNGHRSAVLRYGLALRALLARPVWAAVRRGVRATRLDSAEGFLAYRKGEIRRLKTMLEQQEFTGHQFHAMRKIVSRQVSFHDTARSLEPDDHAYRMSRFLSAINGLMGSRHDEMVEQAIAGAQDYGSMIRLDDDIRQRLDTLVARYPL
ncbi:MAG: hypothetical protein QM605_15030 [Sphingobium sp.]